MAKRIYENNVVKWGGASVGTAGAFAILLFSYLSFLGVIEITGHSGDSICAGTIEDPCYAYINMTAKDDVFIYPVGYDPYGRETTFEFSPGVESWRLERKWGSGWRDIPLDKTCTGTWCGAPNSDGVSYSYALRNGRDYEFRIVAYKNDPNDVIKWAVNYDGREYLDPTWLPVNSTNSSISDWLEDSTVYHPENNTCTAIKNNMLVEIYPCVAQDFDGKDITQNVDFTWLGGSSQNVGWVFSYPTSIESGSFLVETNVTEQRMVSHQQWINNYLITNIDSYVNTTNEVRHCNIGSANNTQQFNVTRIIPTPEGEPVLNNSVVIETYCFDSVSVVNATSFRISGHRDTVITEDYEVGRMVDRTNLISHMGNNLLGRNYSYYQITESNFNPGQTIKTQWIYTPSEKVRNGKWNILGYNADIGLGDSINANQYIFVDPWWNNSWGYKKQINLTETSGSNLTDYEVLLNITYTANMDANFTDLIFTESTETSELDFWIQNKSESNWALVWVEVPLLVASSNTTIYMYYGNPGASSASNGFGTFNFFDDFDDASINYSIWNSTITDAGGGASSVTEHDGLLDLYRDGVINSYAQAQSIYQSNVNEIVESLTQLPVGTSSGSHNELYVSVANRSDTGVSIGPQFLASVRRYNGAAYEGVTNGNAAGYTQPSYSFNELAWNNYRFDRVGSSSVNYYINGVSALNVTGNVPVGPLSVTGSIGNQGFAFDGTGKRMYFDWYFVRDYATSTPTYEVGPEEEPALTPPEFAEPIPQNDTVSFVEDWVGVDFDLVNETDVDTWSVNDNVNFVINSTGYLDNNTVYSVGNYTVTVSVNFTNGASSSTNFTLFVIGTSIQGYAKNGDGDFLDGVTVYIINQSSDLLLGTNTSNGTGYWSFGLLPGGTYVVSAVDKLNNTLDGDIEPHITIP